MMFPSLSRHALPRASRLAGLAAPLALLAVAGCTDPGFHGTASVREATSGQVSSCRLIENITMKPGVYGPVFGGQGAKYARNKVLDQAAKDGANTVVFDDLEAQGTVYLVKARAYSCPN